MANNKKEINATVDRVIIRCAFIAGLSWIAVTVCQQVVKTASPSQSVAEIQAAADRINTKLDAVETKYKQKQDEKPVSEPAKYQPEPTVTEILEVFTQEQLEQARKAATVNGANPSPSPAEILNAFPPKAIEAAKNIVVTNKKIASTQPEVVNEYFTAAVREGRDSDAKKVCDNKASRSMLGDACDFLENRLENQ